MVISRTKLYTILFLSCVAGYIWLFFNLTRPLSEGKTVGLCLFKHTTNIPCPSCGTTRATLSLVHGDILNSLYINPFGVIIAAIMFITPFWIFVDVVTRKDTSLEFYKKTELILKKRGIAITVILLVAANWIWNITKGL